MRAELATQIAAAEGDIEKQIAELNISVARGGDSAALAQAQGQLRGLTRLQQRIARSDAQGLSSMRGEVAAVVAVAQMLAQQSRPDSSLTSPAVVQLYLASAQARGTVNSFVEDYYGNRAFDRYLTFAPGEDEDAYRKREAERQQEIQKAMAEHTPNGDLRAAKLAIEQLKDAGAHGADKSPEYRPMLQGLTGNCDRLAAAAAGADKSNEMQRDADASAPVAANSDTSSAISPDVLATIRAAKIAVTDPSQESNGVVARIADSATQQRYGR